MTGTTGTILKPSDFQSSQEPRWCPGCGDYAILKQVQTVLAEKGYQPHEVVFISGIGCSSRFPYYMNTYGMHTIHGRAPAIATGLKVMRPDLSVWVITGDGDALAIGGNHLIHALRRNVDINILLFNNEIYGLTKGQYSPTSELYKVTKSSPWGTAENPFNPVLLALSAGATFVARTIDREVKHQREILKQADDHKGVSFVEIYQNCNVFNDGAFADFTDKKKQPETTIFLKHGEPAIFGVNRDKCLVVENGRLKVVKIEPEGSLPGNVYVHDETSLEKAMLVASLFGPAEHVPRPFGVFYRVRKPTYEEQLRQQRDRAKEKMGEVSLQDLLYGDETWQVK